MTAMDVSEQLRFCRQLIRSGALADAERECTVLLDRCPDDPAALNLMGVVHRHAGRLDQAEASFLQALDRAPGNPALHRNLALLRLGSGANSPGQPEPGSPDEYGRLGRACARNGRLEEALAHFSEALARRPGDRRLRRDRARLFRHLGRLDDARLDLEHLLDEHADHATCLQLAEVLLAQHQPTLAERRCREALARETSSAGQALLARALLAAGRPAEALEACLAALQIDPAHAAALGQLARVQRGLDRIAEALDSYRCALAVAADDTPLRIEFARTLLLAGHRTEAWALIDRCAAARGFAACPCWRGEPPAGRRIVLHGAADWRDLIQFVRFAPLLQRLGARVWIDCPEPLRPLAATVEGVEQVLDPAMAGPGFDFHCPLPALPHLLGDGAEPLGEAVPYLAVPPDAAPSFAGGFGVINVGLAWRADLPGTSGHDVPLTLIEPALRMHGLRFHALQSASDPRQAALLAECGVEDRAQPCARPAEAAACLSSLDLVVAADCVIAHLAAALGKPVWLLAHYDCDWRWPRGTEASPWYPTVRLFRQRSYGDWVGNSGRLVIELARLVGGELRLATAPRLSGAPIEDKLIEPARVPPAESPGLQVHSCRHGAMCFRPGDAPVAASLSAYREFAEDRNRSIERFLRRGDTVVEVGAGIGEHTLALARRVGPGGRVWAFEADPELFRLLSRNLGLNRLDQVQAQRAPSGDGGGPGEPEIDRLPLSSLRVLILDLGRAGPGVLQAAAGSLARLRPLVMMRNADASAIRLLGEIGYRGWSARVPLFRSDNFAGVRRNIFGDASLHDVYGIPDPASGPPGDIERR